jgi:serine/threonine protein kinase
MEYANKGNLRECLIEVTNNWEQKLYMLFNIIFGLNSIHEKGLIHCNFHDGNILCNKYEDYVYGTYIADYLGSNQLATSFLRKNNIHGVIPFMAPEVLKGQPYTQASDIYSFSIIMWEFISGVPPFNNRAHDIQLALNICKGERPEIIDNIPQCYIDLMKKCWDEDPLKRPSASKVLNIFKNWIFLPSKNIMIKNINKELISNIIEFINSPIEHNNLIIKSHSQVFYTSHLLGFTSEELNEILEGSLELKFLELKQQKEDNEQELLKLEMIAETYYQSSQNELKEKQMVEIELDNLQQKNSQFEHDNQKLRLDLAIQIKEFAEKENTLQTQITHLQNEKQALASNLSEQLEQNKLINQQVQIQIGQLKQEKIILQEKLSQIETNIQELKYHQEFLIEQKEQLENKLSQSQINCEQVEQEKIFSCNMMEGLSQDQKLTIKLKSKLAQLGQELSNEEQIKVQLIQALQIKEDKIYELGQKLIDLDYERIEKLKDKRKELSKIKEELVNKLTYEENTKEIHKEKETKQKELDELEQELFKTSTSYDANRKKQVLDQVNNFLKAKGDFLTLREEAITKLQDCYSHLESTTIKDIGLTQKIVRIENIISEVKFADKHTKEFQNILVKYSNGLLQLDKDYSSLMNIIQKNKELEVSLAIENILKLNSFNLDKYNIFKFATNSQEGTKTQLNSSMMAEDIKSLKKNLNELKLELDQEKKELELLGLQYSS